MHGSTTGLKIAQLLRRVRFEAIQAIGNEPDPTFLRRGGYLLQMCGEKRHSKTYLIDWLNPICLPNVEYRSFRLIKKVDEHDATKIETWNIWMFVMNMHEYIR